MKSFKPLYSEEQELILSKLVEDHNEYYKTSPTLKERYKYLYKVDVDPVYEEKSVPNTEKLELIGTGNSLMQNINNRINSDLNNVIYFESLFSNRKLYEVPLEDLISAEVILNATINDWEIEMIEKNEDVKHRKIMNNYLIKFYSDMEKVENHMEKHISPFFKKKMNVIRKYDFAPIFRLEKGDRKAYFSLMKESGGSIPEESFFISENSGRYEHISEAIYEYAFGSRERFNEFF